MVEQDRRNVNILRKSNSAGPGLFQEIEVERKREKTSSNLSWSESTCFLVKGAVAVWVLWKHNNGDCKTFRESG